MNPKAAVAFRGRALVHLKSGRLDSAISDYDEALRLQVNNAHTLYGRGLAKQKKGDAAAASTDMAAAEAIQADIAEEFRRFGIPRRPSESVADDEPRIKAKEACPYGQYWNSTRGLCQPI